jgi:hypothetical protein
MTRVLATSGKAFARDENASEVRRLVLLIVHHQTLTGSRPAGVDVEVKRSTGLIQ